MTRRRALVGVCVLSALVVAVVFWPDDEPSDEVPPVAGAARDEPSTNAAPTRIESRAGVDAGSTAVAALSPAVRIGDAPLDGGVDAGEVALDRAATAVMVNAWLATNARAAEKYIDRFCDESKRVKALKAFGERPRTKDAAIYLSVRVDWENGRVGMLHLPRSLTDRMGNPPLSWRNFGPADYAGLDFTWLKDLAEFDYWSLSTDGPIKDSPTLSYFDAPLPNFVQLQHWVKLRLVKGKFENDLPQASLEVRHLADLIASSGTLVAEMIRAAIYGIERGYWELLGLTPPEPLPSAEAVLQMRHTGFASMYFLYPGVPRAVRTRALACMPIRCTALTESIGATAAMRELVPNAEDDLQWLLAQAPCDPVQAERLSRGPPLDAAMLRQSFSGEGGLERAMRELLDGGL